MNGFRRKLRQFRKDWVRRSRPAARAIFEAPPLPRGALGFLFNADDTPRGARLDTGWPPAEHAAAMVRRAFPRFRELAANQGEQRAA